MPSSSATSARASTSRAGNSRAGTPGLGSMRSLTRALSPALSGIVDAEPGEASHLRLVQGARSFEDLLATVPVRFREVVSPILRDIMDIADKAESSARQLRRLQADKAAGTLPPQIAGAVKVPPLQLTQLFRENVSELVTEYEEAMRADRKSVV